MLEHCWRHGGGRASCTQTAGRRSLLTTVVVERRVSIVDIRSSVHSSAHRKHTARTRPRAHLHTDAEFRGDQAGVLWTATQAGRVADWTWSTCIRRVLSRPQERRRSARTRLHVNEGSLLSTTGDLLLNDLASLYHCYAVLSILRTTFHHSLWALVTEKRKVQISYVHDKRYDHNAQRKSTISHDGWFGRTILKHRAIIILST